MKFLKFPLNDIYFTNFNRLYNIEIDNDLPFWIGAGHVARVFNSVWSPTVPGLLATGSDDENIYIWNTKSKVT